MVRELEARSAGFYLLEEIIPAQDVLKVLTAHLREVSTLLSGRASDPDDELRRRLIVAAGESSLLAGWSASALGDSAAARNFYDTAITAASQARDPAITACALTYRSYIPSAKGANGRARIFLAEALENVPDTTSPATTAWVAARHAEESALLGDKAQALRSWRRAEEAFSIADPDEDRPWSRFLNRDRFDTFRVATYLKVGKFDEAQHVAADLLARLSPAEGKRAAVIRENIAAAHLARGSASEAARVAQSGLAIVRETEFAMWLPKFEDIAQGPAALPAAAAGPRLPRGVRHDQAPVRPVPALIRSCTAAACATSSSTSPISSRASGSGRRRSTPPKKPCPSRAARSTAGSVCRIREIRILLQKTGDEKTSKERMHLDLEADDVEAEVRRLEALGATRWDHQAERGFDFWVLRDPWGNEFCVLQPEFPELLARQEPWNHRSTTG